MSVVYSRFTTQEHLNIKSDSITEAIKLFGLAEQNICKQFVDRIHAKLKYSNGYAYRLADSYSHKLKNLIKSDCFVIGGINWLARYYDYLISYSQGAGIPLTEAIVMQMEMVSGCQTIISHNTQINTINCLHLEENIGDPDLIKYYSGVDENQVDYSYRIVEINSNQRKIVFFAYPGLCFAGPAVSYDITNRRFVATDTIATHQTWPEKFKSDIWINAIASIIFDLSDPLLCRKFVAKLKKYHLSVTGSYAMHLAGMGQFPRIESYEIGSQTHRIFRPYISIDKEYIVGLNWPRDLSLQSRDHYRLMDVNDPEWSRRRYMLSMSMHRRKQNLILVAKTMINRSDTPDDLETLISDPHGDLERTKDGRYVYNGFITPYLVGYGLAVLKTDQDSIKFGKRCPPENPQYPYRFWYHSTDSICLNYARKNLWKAAGKK